MPDASDREEVEMTDPELRRLRDANPVSEPTLRADPHEQQAYRALRRQLFEQVEADTQPDRSLRRRLRRWRIPFAVLVVAGASAAYLSVQEQPTQRLSVACHKTASLDADAAVVSNATAAPVATCARLWREGELGDGPVPRMEACVLPSGSIGVFPSSGGEVCNRLGLARMTPGAEHPAAGTERLLAMREALVRKISGERRCLDVPEARAIVRHEFATHGLTDWGIRQVAPLTDERPCVSLAFDEEGRFVVFVPMVRPQR